MRDHAIEKVFSLFTSPDRAVAIAGDLAEESEHRGKFWFWMQAVRVTLALGRSAAMDAPLRESLELVLLGLVLFAAAAFSGVAVLFLVPPLMESPMRWIVLPALWWGGAFCAGAALIAFRAPQSSWMALCAVLAVGVESVLIGMSAGAVWGGDWSNTEVLFGTTGMIAAMVLLAGAAFAHRRKLASCSMQEGQR